MHKILFLTFGQGHLVSDREFNSMQKGFAKVGMELLREATDYDLILVKGWSHTWQQVQEKNILNKPVVYLSIGTEWKLGWDASSSEPVRELYQKADYVVHISQYCMDSHHAFWPSRPNESVIIPYKEANLPGYEKNLETLKLAITCIPRPVKRIEEIERLCDKDGIELHKAYGSVTDFSYYHDVNGGVCLSRKEGMPNNVLEMLAYGLPCIVTNYGGAKEAIGPAGIVIENDPATGPWNPSNIEPIKDELWDKAINEFKERYENLRYLTREWVKTHNDQTMAQEFKQVFECLK